MYIVSTPKRVINWVKFAPGRSTPLTVGGIINEKVLSFHLNVSFFFQFVFKDSYTCFKMVTSLVSFTQD